MRIFFAIFTLALAAFVVAMVTNSDRPKDISMNENSEIDAYAAQRLQMVDRQIRRRGIQDSRVLKALEKVPRHLFVPPEELSSAYDDSPLPIGYKQTISQPYIVALMTEVLKLERGDKVLEIGTGSGYQAAILAELVDSVFSIEIVEALGRAAEDRLKRLGYGNVTVRIGDGYKGWIEESPFDAIIVTAAPETVPLPLLDQLADGGRMVIPVGAYVQELELLTKQDGRIHKKSIASVRFVPMVSEEGKESQP
ncbi:MAG: protein-L-isoaspartate(D-aspartate) O-methyltransferase [Chitinivibrionia bacterium]|nr:protein-L-isoaspartate(D-aspartate) O-methyltransferase [Chitinivibrionia bacterium]